MNTKIKHIFFDLDGTLIDSIPDITSSLNCMRKFYGLEQLTNETIANIVGKGFPTTVRRVLSIDMNKQQVEKNASEAINLTMKAYEEKMGENTVVYKYVIDMLEFCNKSEINLSIVTNKEYNHAIKILEKLDLLKYFSTVVGGDTTKYYKPNPAPLKHAIKIANADISTSIMVGDSDNDYICAQQSGVSSVLITHGYHHGINFKDLEVDLIISNFKELVEYIKTNNN